MTDLFDNFTKRLINDLQSSWQKTAILGVLFCVGLCLWVPPLIRTLTGKSASNTQSPVAVKIAESVVSTPHAKSEQNTVQNWKQMQSILEQDELVRPAAPDSDVAKSADPFEIDWSQFSPPVLFAEEPESEPEVNVANQIPPLELILKSTIIGRNLRAAMINSKLYREGSTFQIQQHTFQLKAVQHRQVVLSDGVKEFVLRLETKPNPINMNISGSAEAKSSLNKNINTEIK